MTVSFSVVNDTLASAQENMQQDKSYLKNIEENSVILRFYKWDKFCITYGLSKKSKQFLNEDLCNQDSVPYCVRPTGGGIVFHGDNIDFTYSLIVGKSVSDKYLTEDLTDNYRLLHSLLIKALEKNNIAAKLCNQKADNNMPESCFLRFALNDVLYKNKKIAGAAQRLTKTGFLHQGYISLDYTGCAKYLKDTTEEDFQKYTFPLKNILSTDDQLETLKENIIEEFKTFFMNKTEGDI